MFFDTGGRNRYGQASIRGILNDISGTAPAFYASQNWSETGHYQMKSLASKLSADDGFLRCSQKTVNKTFVNSHLKSGVALDKDGCEHVVDKFWILGSGNINCTGLSGNINCTGLSGLSSTVFKDYKYDTSILS